MLRVRASSYADTLITSLNYARSEAITRNQRIVMCASDDGLSCAATQVWDSGWIVMVQDDNTILRYKNLSAPQANIALTTTAGVNIDDRWVIYTSSGETHLENAVGGEIEQVYLFSSQIAGCNNPQLNIRREVTVAISGLITVNPRLACL